MKFIDLTGKRFGKLTVLGRAPDRIAPSGGHQTMWYCVCDCNPDKVLIKNGYRLRTGAVKSCGCYQKDSAREKRIKSNRYDLTNEYGIGYTSKNEEFYFDLEDYDKIKNFCWFIDGCGYVTAKLRDGSGKHILMHNLVMGQKYNDHINSIRNDNRKSNLRIPGKEDGRVSYSFDSINNMNKRIQRNNKSGVPGVHWHKRDNIWESYISVNNKRLYLGRYTDFDEAVAARKAAEEKYFKSYSYDNSQKISDKIIKEKNI